MGSEKEVDALLAAYEDDHQRFPGKKNRTRQRKKKVDVILHKRFTTDSRTALKQAGFALGIPQRRLTPSEKKNKQNEDEYQDMLADAFLDCDIPAPITGLKDPVKVIGRPLADQTKNFQGFINSIGNNNTNSWSNVVKSSYSKKKPAQYQNTSRDYNDLNDHPFDTFSESSPAPEILVKDINDRDTKLETNKAKLPEATVPSQETGSLPLETNTKPPVANDQDSTLADLTNVVSLLQKLSGGQTDGLDILSIVQTVLSRKNGKIETEDENDVEEQRKKDQFKKKMKLMRKAKKKHQSSESESEDSPDSDYKSKKSHKKYSKKRSERTIYESDSHSGSDYDYEMYKAMKKFKKYQALKHQKVLKYRKQKSKYSDSDIDSDSKDSDAEFKRHKKLLKKKLEKEQLLLLEKEKEKYKNRKNKKKYYSSEEETDSDEYERDKEKVRKKKLGHQQYDKMRKDYENMSKSRSKMIVEEPSDYEDGYSNKHQRMLTYDPNTFDEKSVGLDSEDDEYYKKGSKKSGKPKPNLTDSDSDDDIDYNLRSNIKSTPKPTLVYSDSDSDGYYKPKSKSKPRKNPIDSDSDSDSDSDYRPKVKSRSKPNPTHSDSEDDYRANSRSKLVRENPIDSDSDEGYTIKPRRQQPKQQPKANPLVPESESDSYKPSMGKSKPNPMVSDSDSDKEYTPHLRLRKPPAEKPNPFNSESEDSDFGEYSSNKREGDYL